MSRPPVCPSLPEAKRALERAFADPRILEDPSEELLALRPLWDAKCTWTSPEIDAYRAHIAARLALRSEFRSAGSPLHRRLRAWRSRQIARCRWDLPPATSDAIVHAPFALELSQGCSVGCWFCGVGATRLSSHWTYDPVLWPGMLTELVRILGLAAGYGFLYWATDPLDNPDYEHFCQDFCRLTGRYPQTTTALALRNVERTRAVLRMSRELGCPVNRFSVLTLRQLDRIYAAFSPDELMDVELVLQNPESQLVKARAGKARGTSDDGSTIACVSGFLINAVQRTVKLVSPCSASERWPLGYRIHGVSSYEDGASFGAALDALVDGLPEMLPLEGRVAFHSGLHFSPLKDGFRLASSHTTATFANRDYPPMAALGAGIAAGAASATELAVSVGREVMPSTMFVLDELFQLGLLDDDPLVFEGISEV